MKKLVVREDFQRHPILRSIYSAVNLRYEDVIQFNNSSIFKSLRQLILIEKGSVVIISDPIIFFLIKLFSIKEIKIIFFSLEMFEHQVSNSSLRNFIRNKVFKTLHFWALKASNTIIFPNEIRRRFYKIKLKGKLRNAIILPNLPSKEVGDLLERVSKESKKDIINILGLETILKNQYKAIISYAGTISKSRGIDKLIEFFKEHHDYCFIMAGDDSPLIADLSPNILFLGRLSKIDSLRLVRLSDIQLTYYSTDIGNTRFCAPVKVYESIALKTPVMVNENPGIIYSNLSELVNLYKPESIEKNLKELIQSKEKLEKVFSKIFDVRSYDEILKESKIFN